MPEHPHAHATHQGHSRWPLVGLGAAGALIAAPFVLPAIGLGSTIAANTATAAFHAHSLATGGGLAGLVARGIDSIPLVGPSLAAGGWASIATSGVVGIGGVLLANWLSKRERAEDFPWSKVIRYGSLATSMLISLPSLLTGIGIGITFLANFFIDSREIMNPLIEGLTNTLGTAPMAHMGSGGGGAIATMLPHLLGCGASIIPLSIAQFLNGKPKPTNTSHEQPASYGCQLAAPCNPTRGQLCELVFQLIDQNTSKPLCDKDLEVVHTRPLHTMMVDSSLRDYHHLHPTYDPARKAFVCHFTPALNGQYAMWNDFTVKGEQQPTHLKTELGMMRGMALPARVEHTSTATAEGVTVRLSSEQRLSAGGDAMLTLDIRDAAGQPVTNLEPIMGAYAHLVGFSSDGKHFIHSHPLGAKPQSQDERGSSPLHFHVSLPHCSGVKFFLQIQREGKMLTLPFGQAVAQSPMFMNRPRQSAHQHSHMAIA